MVCPTKCTWGCRTCLYLFWQICSTIGLPGTIPGSVTKGVITLLKKGGRHVWEGLDDYRPITLLNTEFQILARVLANRLQLVISDLIGPEQTFVVKGRSIPGEYFWDDKTDLFLNLAPSLHLYNLWLFSNWGNLYSIGTESIKMFPFSYLESIRSYKFIILPIQLKIDHQAIGNRKFTREWVSYDIRVSNGTLTKLKLSVFWGGCDVGHVCVRCADCKQPLGLV